MVPSRMCGVFFFLERNPARPGSPIRRDDPAEHVRVEAPGSRRPGRRRPCEHVGMTPPDIAAKASEMLRALSHPLRLQIVEQLSIHEHRCVHELVDSLAAPQPAVSQHLRVLRAARLVVGQRVGKEVRYALIDNHVSHIVVDALAHAREPPDG